MHEFGLCQSVVEVVERRAAGRPVTEVRLRVGALHRVQEEAMSQAFSFAAVGTVAQNAAVRVMTMPVRMRCDACGAKPEGSEMMPACPKCQATTLTLTGGDELLLESIRFTAGASEQAHERIREADDGHTHEPAGV
jgi:hydrogenase nickel incorporation protein HypA/HybF